MTILQNLLSYKKTHDLNFLSNSLSGYGLQPTDWKLTKENHRYYKIIHKTEPNFYFIGKVKYKKGRKAWHSIHLAGL